MEEKSKINNLKINKVIENTSLQKEPILEGELTGYPSIDKPWLKKYPEFLFSSRRRSNNILNRLKSIWTNPNDCIINYYDTEITVNEFFDRINSIAKSLISYGIKKGDSIVVSLESTPEFLELLLASETVGCSIKNYLGDIDSTIKIINNDNTVNYYVAPDYLSKEESDKIYNLTNIKNIITINPLFSVKDKSKLRENITEQIFSKYSKNKSCDLKNISWDEFLKNGEKVNKFKLNDDNNVKLFSGFTSGTTGEPKEVIHSSKSILGIIEQMSLFPSNGENRESWLLTILPPTLVAVVVAMMCYPLADGKKLILDPYCKLEDIDIEMMHYRPECWALIPIFFQVLLDSNRIPEDYDMSYFKLFGFGAEPMTNKFINKVHDFKVKHNCNAPLSCGYGQSEGGSDLTVAMGEDMLLSGSSGIPLIDTTISIFNSETIEELKYNQIGEICKTGPGIMLGYSNDKLTNETLKLHSDGKIWLHTGDSGFMTDDGLLYVLGRKGIKVNEENMVFPLTIENKISMIDGVKDAIVVSGRNEEYQEFEVPYLFVVPELESSPDELLIKINMLINNELSPEEKPKKIFFIDKKPISKFKTDRKRLQKEYKLI